MSNLTEIIYQYKDNEVKWGEFDCCIFTVKVVEEYFDIQLPYWRDMIIYDSYKESLKILKKNGINSVLDLPDYILGTSKKLAIEAKLGEPVYVINEDNQGALGVCNGQRAYFLHPKKGLVAGKLDRCLYSWSVEKCLK